MMSPMFLLHFEQREPRARVGGLIGRCAAGRLDGLGAVRVLQEADDASEDRAELVRVVDGFGREMDFERRHVEPPGTHLPSTVRVPSDGGRASAARVVLEPRYL